ncbi:MAG TPA: heme ABC transporter permease [Rhodanobacteraceae bacterium]|nr:heme ABC transporter permease [Rhodanobacteraceae bacterium]
MSRSYLPHWMHWLGSPPNFYRFAGTLRPWLMAVALISAVAGLYGGLVLAPPDYQQGDAYRIIFIHVPSAWMSLFIYATMAVAGLVALVWRVKLAEVIAMECAPIGAAFTLVTLVTGSLWGKPMWGTWWTWDARLTSELVLLFLYLGVIGLYNAFEDHRRGARAASLLALVGIVNLPIVHYSVQWWNTLHQGTTVNFLDPARSSIAPAMLWPLLVMALATHLYFFASLLGRARTGLLSLESGKQWVRALVGGQPTQTTGAPT